MLSIYIYGANFYSLASTQYEGDSEILASKVYFLEIINNDFVFMLSQNDQSNLMLLMESDQSRSVELFLEILNKDNHHYSNFQKLQSFHHCKLNFENINFQENVEFTEKDELAYQNQQNGQVIYEKQKYSKQASIQPEFKDNHNKLLKNQKNKNYYSGQKQSQSKKTTKCWSILAEQKLEVQEEAKNTGGIVADFSTQNNQIEACNGHIYDNKKKKIKKRLEKYIFKEKKFGRALKISFPKKIVQMFINHYESIQTQQEVREYNDNLKLKLKQNKKNDYTFEKQVSQILGEGKVEQPPQLKMISLANRKIFSQIIKSRMKQQVIMRDKIAKNRQLYMIQLKVYALRCRSHRLSKKGTYK